MDSRSRHDGRHELGQNHLHHRATLERIDTLVRSTSGPILEIGPGDGALTDRLVPLGRDLTVVELDERRARHLRRRHPRIRVVRDDVLRVALDRPTIVGNIPFHLTTPILRHLLGSQGWRDAILLTQWEVARKRAGVGGRTMLTAQSDPWFTFTLHGRVPASGFRPAPGVDGGLLHIRRRERPLVPPRDRRPYATFIRCAFTGRGGTLAQSLTRTGLVRRERVRAVLGDAGVHRSARPRDLRPEQWARLWYRMHGRHP